jgi:hypothetical protein
MRAILVPQKMKIKNQEKRWGYAHLTAADAPKHNNERNQMRRVNTTGKADGKGRDVPLGAVRRSNNHAPR